MEHNEVFWLFLTALIVVGALVGFALARGVDGTVFGSGIGGLCVVIGYSVKTLVGNKRGKRGERGYKGDKGEQREQGGKGL